MYKCYECDAVFEEPKTWEEDRGEFWGTPCTEKVSGCPKCRQAYGEVDECKRCGELHFTDDMCDGFCDCCFDELFL